MSEMKVHYMSERHDWGTPESLFQALQQEFGFTLDACASPHNAKCPRYFSAEIDGLAQDWGREFVWMNPPYGHEIAKWMKRAYEASSEGGATVVCLVPARTDTRWWHRWALKANEIRFFQGRLKFTRPDGTGDSAPFPSALVIYRPVPSFEPEIKWVTP